MYINRTNDRWKTIRVTPSRCSLCELDPILKTWIPWIRKTWSVAFNAGIPCPGKQYLLWLFRAVGIVKTTRCFYVIFSLDLDLMHTSASAQTVKARTHGWWQDNLQAKMGKLRLTFGRVLLDRRWTPKTPECIDFIELLQVFSQIKSSLEMCRPMTVS